MFRTLFSTTADDKASSTEVDEVITPMIPSSPTLVASSPAPAAVSSNSKKRKFSEIDEDDQLGAGVTITVGGDGDSARPFDCHRNMLCAKSGYFRDQFAQHPHVREISISDEDPNVFRRIQHWVYFKQLLTPTEQEAVKAEDVSDTVNINTLQHAYNDICFRNESDDGPSLDEEADDDSGAEGGQSPEIPSDFGPEVEASSNTMAIVPRSPSASANEESSNFTNPLDVLLLCKIYALAARLEMHTLCNEIIDILGKRLDEQTTTPSDALIFAFERTSLANSPLPRLLVDFTVGHAPLGDFLASSSQRDIPQELTFELLSQMTLVRDVYREKIKEEKGIDLVWEKWPRRFQRNKEVYYC